MPVCVVITVLIADQLTKFLATRFLSLNNPVSVINNLFSFTLVYNRGAAFGVLKDQTYLFIFFSVVAITLICFSLKKSRKDKLYAFSLSLLLGGALGNLIDRLLFGHVIDFLDFHIWPVFNIADSAISVGAVILGWSIIRGDRRYVS